MKHVLTAVALATTLIAPVWAQNVAIVNGKPVPSSRVNELVQQIEKGGRKIDPEMKDRLKEEVIVREIFAQEAEKRGVKATPEYRLGVQTLLIRVMFQEFQDKNKPTDAEIKAEYDKFTAANSGQEIRASHILVESEDEAKAIIADIKKGGKFEDIAKKQSKDSGSAVKGGDLDWANPSNFVPEFSEAMLKLAKGQMTDTPVKSQFGFHIIRVDDTRKAEMPKLEEIKPQITQQLTQKKLAEFQESLRGKAKVQ